MLFGASDNTFGYADTYLTIYTSGTIFALLATGLNSYLIAQGYAGLGMLSVIIGAVLNIVLDPVFIFLLHMGRGRGGHCHCHIADGLLRRGTLLPAAEKGARAPCLGRV